MEVGMPVSIYWMICETKKVFLPKNFQYLCYPLKVRVIEIRLIISPRMSLLQFLVLNTMDCVQVQESSPSVSRNPLFLAINIRIWVTAQCLLPVGNHTTW